MINVLIIHIISICSFILINKYFFYKKKLLLNDTGEGHQKFSTNKITPLTGGLFIFLNLSIYKCLYTFNHQLFFFLFTILILGIFSDLKLIKSAKLKLFYQFLISIIFIKIYELKILDTRVDFIDFLINQREILNYFFVCFCFLILINGSNFIDGLNTLNLGYFLLISICLLFLSYNEVIEYHNIYLYITIVLIISYLLNSINIFFLGDSGSYLLGFLFAFILIDLNNSNQNISPFFIILLLWYPCFETLFSMLRKKILNRSSMKPDSNHLHQLIFFNLKKKFKNQKKISNFLSANIINVYNLLIILISVKFISQTQIQIILIMINLIVYTLTYFKLFLIRYKKI